MDENTPKRIALFGPQGSGKGTQAERITKTFGIPHIAPGNIFRKAIADKTELGEKAETVLNSGQLMPNEITNGLMQERIEQEDALDGFIFDGYPRNQEQADALDGMTNLSYVIVIDVPEAESIKRISHRRSCPQCGATYHIDFKKPQEEGICDACGTALVQRDDDKPDAIKQRLAIYHAETAPLLKRYKERGILHEVDGMGTIDEIWERIQKVLWES
jgi:adenylate kinase